MTPTVETAAAQALRGVPLATGGKTECTDCHRTVREGDEVAVYAIRAADADQFDTSGVYCRECRSESLPYHAPDARQVTVYGRLGVTTDTATRDTRLTLRDPDAVAHAICGTTSGNDASDSAAPSDATHTTPERDGTDAADSSDESDENDE